MLLYGAGESGWKTVILLDGTPEAPVSLASAGVGTSLVADGVAPTLEVKGLIEGTGITFVDDGDDITISTAISGDPPYAQVCMVPNAWTGYSFDFTVGFTEILPVGASYMFSSSSDFSNASGTRLKYLGATTTLFLVVADYSIAAIGSYAISIAKNGTPIVSSQAYRTSEGTLHTTSVVSLATNDELSIYGLRSVASTRTLVGMCMVITKIPVF